MADINFKVEAWKNKLLDLGKRNRLLNYRDTKRSSLKIISPNCFDLWNSFVLNEKTLEFPFYNEYDNEIIEEENNNDSNIKTNQNIKDMQKTLRNLRDKAKTVIEEQGVNVLYLSFGFLKWSESKDSEQYFFSPIILVPVSLSVESITAPFVLSLHEDEIVINPTLVYKLENDFGIRLPQFDEESDIKDYFNQIRAIIVKNRWEILPDAGLSLLSFLKINMYRDLEIHKDTIVQNPIIRMICGDATATMQIPEEIDYFDYDSRIKPIETFQVVDADSSQQDAILCAKKGLSFVLQGPPGTGKSQTITNIIAECLADGKKVLFVSEKMAALEVVHRRLTNAGLDDFCLTLHNHKANKKEILEQLGKVFSLAKKKATLSDEVYQKLDLLQEDRKKLNEYANEIYTVVQPLGKSIYEVNGILANLQNCDEIIFNIDSVADATQQKYNRYLTLLTQFIETIGNMSDDYKHNPWNDANVSAVTNELRHDIGAKLNKLMPKIINAISLFDSMSKELSIVYCSSYFALTSLVNILELSADSPKVPVSWILGENTEPLFSEIQECESLKAQYQELQNRLAVIYETIKSNDHEVSITAPSSIVDSITLCSEISFLRRSVDKELCYTQWQKDENFSKIAELYSEAKSKIQEANSIREKLLVIFEEGIFDIDYKGIYERYKREYTSVFKVFKRQYKADIKQFKGLYKTIMKKVTDQMVIEVLNSLCHYEEINKWISDNQAVLSEKFCNYYDGNKTKFEVIDKKIVAFDAISKSIDILSDMKIITDKTIEQELVLKNHYQFLYNGINTDWESIRAALTWANAFRLLVEKNNINKEFVNGVCTNDDIIASCEYYAGKIKEMLADIDIEFVWYLDLFENKSEIKSIEMPALLDRITRCVDNLYLLEEWIDFKAINGKCKNEGLSDFISKIEEMHIDTTIIIPIFKKRFFRLWLDAILPQFPAVLNFRRRVHEGTISEFASLDKVQFEIAKARIQSKLINDLPSLDHFTNGVDEISILKRELGKQRRIMPIRKLFKEIPHLLLTLKPCLMMSPLSVSLFLEADSYMFDTIIFDEASQVLTENGIGAISRGKQVIIAGDSKQLPPTNFFSAATSDLDFDTDDEDEYGDVNAYESILDEAGLLPERTLLWHYRSRHEHLIAFSNMKIYKNNLITFPSNIDKIADNGVEYIYVQDGFYDRGGKKGNVIEAKKVAETVFDVIRKYPSRSIGVIAFGEVQQQAIDTAMRQMRVDNQQYESFFKEDKDEPFFIKNLENVQGDERDTIIFSIGYAKDAAGVFRMNFGPLSKSGGERRLNVAITRAKYNVKLIGSILPTDIDIERINADGPKILRSYIDFAINGISSLIGEINESDIVEHDSPFEKAVYNFLDQKGYRLSTQVGCSGYRIDMAIKHPKISGQYVIGIECDGAAYHSARTARERDRLRQDVLENMGWKIYRIWSTDWIKDPVTEGQKLIEAVDRAISEYGINDCSEPDIPEKVDVDDFITVDKKVISAEEQSNPYCFAEYKAADLSVVPRNDYGYVQISDCIKVVVDTEYPIHYELLCKKLAYLYGNEKATVKVRRQIDYALAKLKDKIVRRGDFLYPASYKNIIVKIPNNRPINYINTDELAEAMCIIASKCVGTTKEALCAETARVYGFARSGPNITAAMNTAYDVITETDRVKEIDGKVVIQ